MISSKKKERENMSKKVRGDADSVVVITTSFPPPPSGV